MRPGHPSARRFSAASGKPTEPPGNGQKPRARIGQVDPDPVPARSGMFPWPPRAVGRQIDASPLNMAMTSSGSARPCSGVSSAPRPSPPGSRAAPGTGRRARWAGRGPSTHRPCAVRSARMSGASGAAWARSHWGHGPPHPRGCRRPPGPSGVTSRAVAAAGWVGFRSPGDCAAFRFPTPPRHDRVAISSVQFLTVQ
jgi:hypothetical protein